MKILDHHIGARVARGYLLVMAILLSVFSLLALVNELDHVGTGQYRLLDAFIHVVLTLPGRVVDLAPVTALLGSIIGLGELAGRRELIAMQALGVSPLRIGWSALKIGGLFMVAVMALQEFVAPPGEQQAFTRRSQAVSGKGPLWTERGFWSRDGEQIINVRSLLHGQIPSDVDIYQFDEQGRLRLFTHARQAHTGDLTHWLLIDVTQRVVGGENSVTRSLPSLPWESFLTPEQLGILVVPPETLSPSDLYQYVHYLRESGQNADRFDLSLWQQVSRPIATGAMVLVAIPFVFGPLRVATVGKRILAGSIIGIAFHLASQVIGHFGIIYSLNPALSTMAPAAVMLGLALWLFRRAY